MSEKLTPKKGNPEELLKERMQMSKEVANAPENTPVGSARVILERLSELQEGDEILNHVEKIAHTRVVLKDILRAKANGKTGEILSDIWIPAPDETFGDQAKFMEYVTAYGKALNKLLADEKYDEIFRGTVYETERQKGRMEKVALNHDERVENVNAVTSAPAPAPEAPATPTSAPAPEEAPATPTPAPTPTAAEKPAIAPEILAHLKAAIELRENGKLDEAEVNIGEALTLDNTCIPVLLEQGKIFLALDDKEIPQACFEEILEKESDHTEANYQMGLLLEKENPSGSFQHIENAAKNATSEQHPETIVKALAKYGYRLSKMKDLAGAKKAYETVAAMDIKDLERALSAKRKALGLPEAVPGYQLEEWKKQIASVKNILEKPKYKNLP